MQLPPIDERDRNIAPIPGVEQEDDDVSDILEPTNVEEQDDGSALVTLGDPEGELLPADFQENLADALPENELQSLAKDLIDLVEKDKESREKRDKQYEEGLRRTGLGDDAPGGAGFDGASKVVHPILAESCIDFAGRAIKELFPPSGPVKSNIVGKETEDKIELADRKVRFLNWQLTTQMSEYRTELEQLLTQLPMGGSQYQKFYYSPKFRRPISEFVPIDDVFLPYASTDFYCSPRATHVQHITKFEYQQRVSDGLYRDLDIGDPGVGFQDQTASAAANDKIEGKSPDAYNEDGLRDVYEIYTYQELEGDDYTEGQMAPYIITIDAYSEEVLAVYRNWDEDDQNFRKLDWMVEWKFIPWRGAYALGLPHLIGGISAALTGSLRALLDSAHINNSATLIKLKGGRVSGQNLEVEPTQIAEIEGPAGIDDIRKVMMAMPYNQPSPVLFQLLGWLTDAGKGVISTTEDAMSNVGDRTPVGTTMALVEQGSTTYSAIHARLHYSQAKALEIICRINRDFLDEQEIVEDLGELVISNQDFATSRDIVPVSDPNIFSEAQRYAQLQGVLQLKAIFPQLPFNDIAIARRMMRRMRVDNIDEILPEPKKPENMNPVAENVGAMHGAQLLAMPNQNHMAHLYAHLEFATSPIFGSPALAIKMLPVMIEHVTQHIGFYYADMMASMTQFESVSDKMPTKKLEAMIAEANTQVLSRLTSELAPVMQKLQQIQQAWQQMQPPPPMDPAVEATYKTAMAEIERKKARDQAELQIMAEERLTLQREIEQLKGKVDIDKNTLDNAQKRETEILKNNGDNETKRWIAALQMGNELEKAKAEQQLQMTEGNATREHERYLAQVEAVQQLHSNSLDAEAAQREAGAQQQQQQQQQMAGDSTAKTMEALMQTVDSLKEHITKPKKIVRDPNGRVMGIE